MALVPIISQTWDTTSVFNPTRMNTIENNIAIAATAEGTQYSNGVSVKDKIDELANKLNWNYLGDKTGTAEIDLPSNWKELLIQITTNNANLVTYHIYGTQTVNYTNTSFGNYGTSYAVGSISRTKAKINTVNWAGQDVTSSAKMYVYYR